MEMLSVAISVMILKAYSNTHFTRSIPSMCIPFVTFSPQLIDHFDRTLDVLKPHSSGGNIFWLMSLETIVLVMVMIRMMKRSRTMLPLILSLEKVMVGIAKFMAPLSVLFLIFLIQRGYLMRIIVHDMSEGVYVLFIDLFNSFIGEAHHSNLVDPQGTNLVTAFEIFFQLVVLKILIVLVLNKSSDSD
jgi:hypothetical protein